MFGARVQNEHFVAEVSLVQLPATTKRPRRQGMHRLVQPVNPPFMMEIMPKWPCLALIQLNEILQLTKLT